MRGITLVMCLTLAAGCVSSSSSPPPPRYGYPPPGYAASPGYGQPGYPPAASPRPGPGAYPGQVPPAVPQAPSFARVTLVGITFAPNKPDGTQWDGPGRVSAEDVQLIAGALGAADPYAAVLAVLSKPTIQALEKPDAGGTAALVSARGGPGPTTVLNAARDSFTPQFVGPPTWNHVPLDGSVRLRVEVIDRDAVFDDPAGVFEVNRDDMLRALQAGRVYQVRVADQTTRQVLFAGISVMAE